MASAWEYSYDQCWGLWQYTVRPQELFTCVWWFDFDCDTAEDFYALNEVSLVCCVQRQCVVCSMQCIGSVQVLSSSADVAGVLEC